MRSLFLWINFSLIIIELNIIMGYAEGEVILSDR